MPMWITILLGILTNLPEIIEAAKKLWDMISNLYSRKERVAKRKEMRAVIWKHCKSKDPGAAEACKLDLEKMYEQVAYKVSMQVQLPEDKVDDSEELK